VLGNWDLLGDGFDAVCCQPAVASGETYGFAADEQGAVPHDVCLAAVERALTALRAGRSRGTDRPRPSDVEVVGREEVGKRPRSVPALGATDKQWSLHGRIELMVSSEACVLNLRFVEHNRNGKDRALTGRCSLAVGDYSLSGSGRNRASSLCVPGPRTTVNPDEQAV
jgi:hypothetical protein